MILSRVLCTIVYLLVFFFAMALSAYFRLSFAIDQCMNQVTNRTVVFLLCGVFELLNLSFHKRLSDLNISWSLVFMLLYILINSFGPSDKI